MALKTYLLLGALFGLAVCVFAAEDVVPFTLCSEEDSDSDDDSSSDVAEPRSNCTITNLRVNSCPEAAHGEPCKVKRGTTIQIIYDYVPHYSSEKLTSRAYWANALIDMPLLGMDTNACNYTICPVQANQTYTYSFGLLIADFFPVRSYDVKWKLWGDNMECCFLTKIKLVK